MEWIDIAEYSLKYGISQSTLRRRIRSSHIEFKLQKGKYLLPDTQKVFQKMPLFQRQKHSQVTVKSHQIAPVSTSVNLNMLEQQKLIEELIHENKKLREKNHDLETLVRMLESAQ